MPQLDGLMLPLLRYAEDGKERLIGEVVEPPAKRLGLTDQEMAEKQQLRECRRPAMTPSRNNNRKETS